MAFNGPVRPKPISNVKVDASQRSPTLCTAGLALYIAMVFPDSIPTKSRCKPVSNRQIALSETGYCKNIDSTQDEHAQAGHLYLACGLLTTALRSQVYPIFEKDPRVVKWKWVVKSGKQHNITQLC